MKSFGETIKELREKQDLLLKEVASSVDIDLGLLSKIERNERMPTREQVLRFAKFFKAEKDELLILFLSDKLVYELQDEKLGVEALKAAEQKIKYQTNKIK